MLWLHALVLFCFNSIKAQATITITETKIETVFACSATPLSDKSDISQSKLKNDDAANTAKSIDKQGTDFCKTKFGNLPLNDGTQQKTGFCNPNILGAIPSVDKMVSTLITLPEDGASLPVGKPFTVTVNFLNIETGHFSDPKTQYYQGPQTLNAQGIIQGHLHLTIQEIKNPKKALDPQEKTFFKGLDTPSTDGKTLSFEVPGVNTTGNFRLCTITGANTHQGMIMPVAKRGAQDDCIRFSITGDAAGAKNGAANGAAGKGGAKNEAAPKDKKQKKKGNSSKKSKKEKASASGKKSKQT